MIICLLKAEESKLYYYPDIKSVCIPIEDKGLLKIIKDHNEFIIETNQWIQCNVKRAVTSKIINLQYLKYYLNFEAVIFDDKAQFVQYQRLKLPNSSFTIGTDKSSDIVVLDTLKGMNLLFSRMIH